MIANSKRMRFERAQSAYRRADAEIDEIEIAIDARYGRGNRQWAKVADLKRLERLRDQRGRAADRVFAALDAAPAPRNWREAPMHWVCSKLSADDAFRPIGEPLSIVPPTAYGQSEPIR